MIQSIVVGVLFLAAIGFVGRLIYQNFQAKSGCASGCGKCSAVDFQKIEKQIQSKALKN